MDNKDLNNQTVVILQKLCEIAKSAGIDRLSIDNNIIRGMTEDMNLGIFILEPNSFSEILPFDKIGIGRVNTLLARLNLMDISNTTASFSCAGDNDIMVKKLFFKCKKLKLEFNCCDPTHIKSPTKIHDTFIYSFSITQDTINLMSRSKSAFKLENITFSGVDGEPVMFRSNDSDGDKIIHEVAPSYSIVGSSEDEEYDNNFFFTYNIKKLLPIFNVVIKNCIDKEEEIKIVISRKGYMRLKISGIHTYILANV